VICFLLQVKERSPAAAAVLQHPLWLVGVPAGSSCSGEGAKRSEEEGEAGQ